MAGGYPRAVTTEALIRVDPADFERWRAQVVALDDAARRERGHEELGESVWRDLTRPGADSVGFFAGERAYLHLARAEAGAASWTIGIVRHPDRRDPRDVRDLLGAAVTFAAERGGGLLTAWVFGVTDADSDPFTAAGFAATRTLLEMRAPLPAGVEPRWPPYVRVRTFVPERDDAEWLAVNNRAFADHPEQGGWTAATFRARQREPWFDPQLFLLAFDDAGLAGFNWLKLHDAQAPDPVLGEIYVIGVDPRAQGTGLGRALAVAGLDAVAARGATVATLFCAADNAGAVSLYRSLGFATHRTDRAFTRAVAAA